MHTYIVHTYMQHVFRVRQDQQRLEHELDFVNGQQTELEEALRPLEAAVAACTTIDTERERTYQVKERERERLIVGRRDCK